MSFNKCIIVGAYEQGKSIPQVSKEFGVPLSTVRYIVKKAGVLRSHREAAGLVDWDAICPRGYERTFTPEHCKAISVGRRKRFAERPNPESLRIKQGYYVFSGGIHSGQYVHRHVMETIIGRPLTSKDDVHHRDGNRLNNSPENLELTTRSEHASHHAKERLASRGRDSFGRFV